MQQRGGGGGERRLDRAGRLFRGVVPREDLPAGAAGQRPDTSTACARTSLSAAASSSGVSFALTSAGLAGVAPGTRPSGSDQEPCQKPNGMPGSAPPMAVFSAPVTWVSWAAPPTGPVAASAVPEAVDRSCVTARGSAWPAKTARAAATAAATSVVSAAAARTTQWAVIRRSGMGPRGPITQTGFPIH